MSCKLECLQTNTVTELHKVCLCNSRLGINSFGGHLKKYLFPLYLQSIPSLFLQAGYPSLNVLDISLIASNNKNVHIISNTLQSTVNLLKMKCNPLYIRSQFVPRSKHFSPRLWKPISQ